MEELVVYRDELLSALQGVVEKLSETAASISDKAWYLPPGQDGNTPHYTLAHLCALESQLFNHQLQRILSEDAPLLSIFDDVAWMASHYDPQEPAQRILADLNELRDQELVLLRGLPSAGWSRSARHPWWGIRTLQWWVELQLDYSYQHLTRFIVFSAI